MLPSKTYLTYRDEISPKDAMAPLEPLHKEELTVAMIASHVEQ